MKQLGLGLLNYEDQRKFLPPISTNTDLIPDIPGDTTATTDVTHHAPGTAPSSGAGYSWMVRILPEWQEVSLYQSIVSSSQKFSIPAFSPAIQYDPGPNSIDVSSYQLKEYLCPSIDGSTTLDASPRVVGGPDGPVETGTLPPTYLIVIAKPKGAGGIAITSYNAILGTHIDLMAGTVFPARSASLDNSNNGGMKFRGTAFDQGFRLAELTDGLSKVPLVAETRERRFASWYDGTMNWVVAARHSNSSAGTTAITAANNSTPLPGIAESRWTIGTDGTSATGGSALNYGPTTANPTAVYLPTAALADPDISGIAPGRLWGPSSLHRGGIVNHVFADAHVESVSDQIDPNVYLWIVTRDGGEALPSN